MTVLEWTEQKRLMDAETPEDAYSAYRCKTCGKPILIRRMQPGTDWPYGAVIARCITCGKSVMEIFGRDDTAEVQTDEAVRRLAHG